MLAIVTQISIFFTLLAALLRKVQIDKVDHYNEVLFGLLLIFLNCSGIILVILTALAKPFVHLGKMLLASNHSHDGTLRGMNVVDTKEKSGFIDHFIKVSASDEEEGGWKLFHKPTKKWNDFFAYSRAEVAFRNSEGSGPVDEYRVKYEIPAPLKVVMEYALNKNREKRCYEKETYVCGKHTSSEYKQYYVAETMRGGFADRDMLVEEYNGMTHFEGEAVYYIAKRSIVNDDIYSLKKTSTMKRVRAKVVMAGYFLKRVPASSGNGESTSVVYLENIDWGGAFQGLLMNNIVPNQLMIKTDDILAHVDEKTSLFGSSISDGFADTGDIEFTTLNPNITRNLRAVSGGEIGLGEDNQISKHERYKKRDVGKLQNPILADIVGVEKLKEEILPPHIARSASGGFRNTKSLGIKEKKGGTKTSGASKSGSSSSSKKPPDEGVIVTEGKVESEAESRWVAHFDETNACHYYYNTKTHETTWEKPDGM